MRVSRLALIIGGATLFVTGCGGEGETLDGGASDPAATAPPGKSADTSAGMTRQIARFIVNTEESDIPALERAAGEIAGAGSGPFKIRLGRFGAFPSLARPRVLFYSVEEGREEMSALAEYIEDALEPLGFEIERKRFKAHLTLARIKRRVPPDLIEKLESIPPLPGSASQEIGSFTLMKSSLFRSGAVYERIGRFEL